MDIPRSTIDGIIKIYENGIKNFDEKAKEIAEFFTHDCADDGIEYACKHYGLI